MASRADEINGLDHGSTMRLRWGHRSSTSGLHAKNWTALSTSTARSASTSSTSSAESTFTSGPETGTRPAGTPTAPTSTTSMPAGSRVALSRLGGWSGSEWSCPPMSAGRVSRSTVGLRHPTCRPPRQPLCESRTQTPRSPPAERPRRRALCTDVVEFQAEQARPQLRRCRGAQAEPGRGCTGIGR